jgi:hypothetical protein
MTSSCTQTRNIQHSSTDKILGLSMTSVNGTVYRKTISFRWDPAAGRWLLDSIIDEYVRPATPVK